MKVSRRNFLKISGASVAAGGLGFNPGPAAAHSTTTKIANAQKTVTICPYCAVGCGINVYTRNGKVVYTEGDPDHPINRGSLCSKGSALYQISHRNPARLRAPLYRAPRSDRWEQKSWEWTINRIARNIKQSRDESFVENNGLGQVVNRTEGIASVGSAAMDNEECYIYQKFLRALGLVYIEHQARI